MQFSAQAPLSAAEDYFKKYAGGGIPVKVHYLKSAATKPMKLLGIDSARGIIYAEMEGAGRLELELRGCKDRISKNLSSDWSRNAKTYLNYLSNEQYDPRVLTALRPRFTKSCSFLICPLNTLPFMMIA